MRFKNGIVCLLLFSAAIGAVSARPDPQEQKKGLAYDLSVSAISISVTVQDKKGRFINDLTDKDFAIFENDKKQNINYFKHDFEAPWSLTVLLDVSGSMALQNKLKDCKDALVRLATRLLGPKDEVSLLVFADGEVEVASKFSTDRQAFVSVLAKTEAYGQTALNDAVAVSPEFANRGTNEKRALLLVTDGIENDSHSSSDQAIEIARRVDVPIYVLAYKIPLSEQYLQKFKRAPTLSPSGIVATLEQFSGATGGKAFLLNTPEELDAAVGDIKKELSHQYILGYTSYKDPKNEYRAIKVVTTNKKYIARTRAGY